MKNPKITVESSIDAIIVCWALVQKDFYEYLSEMNNIWKSVGCFLLMAAINVLFVIAMPITYIIISAAETLVQAEEEEFNYLSISKKELLWHLFYGWFLAPFTSSYWVVGMSLPLYKCVVIFLSTVMIYSILIVASPILFPISYGMLYCCQQREARKTVINALKM